MPKAQKRKSQDEDDHEEHSNRAGQKAAGRKKAKTGKHAAEKRVNAAGGTVRYSASPSQKVQERIARALPGTILPV